LRAIDQIIKFIFISKAHIMKRIIQFLVAFFIFIPLILKSQNKLENLGANINGGLSEISPVLSKDGNTMYFSRSIPGGMYDINRDIFMSKKSTNGSWSKASRLSNVLNNEGWNSICGISSDGRTILLSGVYMPDGTLKGGFSISHLMPQGWSTPIKLNIPGIPLAYETQTATMSPDGRIIIFSTNCVIGKEFYGGFDLYITQLNEDGSWSKPKNLGKAINSSGFEISPFLAYDGQTLYFSSNGFNGLGGNDLYFSRRKGESWTEWTEPQNLGSTVNTSLWESYICISENSEWAYIGSTAKSLGGMDIHRVKLKPEFLPLKQSLPDTNYLIGLNRTSEKIIMDPSIEKRKTVIVWNKEDEKKNIHKILADSNKIADPKEDLIKKDSVLVVINPVIEEKEKEQIVNETEIKKEEKIEESVIKDVEEVVNKEEITVLEKKKEEEKVVVAPKKEIEIVPAIKEVIVENDETTIQKFIPPQKSTKVKSANTLRKMENLGQTINSAYSEMSPVISPDGKMLFYSRSVPNDPKNLIREIFVSSLKSDNTWSKPQSLGDSVNRKCWNIPCGVSSDGMTILLAGKYLPDGSVKGGFSVTNRLSQGWSQPIPLRIPDFPEQEEIQSGALSHDGKAILFSSHNCIGENFYGSSDLYVTFHQNSTSWSKPLNLGSIINTYGFETTPFLASDGYTLYFSSDGHGGYGSNDIFVSIRLDSTWQNWSPPQNLGPRINTEDWESYFSIHASGDYAYLGSRKNTFGMMDLFKISMDSSMKPKPVILISGKVLVEGETSAQNVSIVYEEIADSSNVGSAGADPQNLSYKICLNAGKVFAFYPQAKGFYGINECINLKDLKAYSEYKKDLILIPLKKGQKIRLNNIFFDRGKSILRSESNAELHRLVEILQLNSKMKIEIGGHTESMHADPQLSQDRANAVADFLYKSGIQNNRVVATGYANQFPVDNSATREGERLNRRVEIKILEIE